MSTSSPSGAVPGWPFLVAAGRRLDYTVVLAPDFLVAAGEGGRLADVVAPGELSDPARLVAMSTPGSRQLAVTYRTHVLTAEDLPGPDGAPAPAPAPPRDEHNRPLRLAYGFVSHAAPDDARSVNADLDACRPLALTAYRRFLDDEPAFTVLPSGPLPIRSVSARTAPPPVPAASSAPPRPTHPVQAGPARRAVLLGLVAAVLALVFAVAVAVRGTSAPPCPTPTELAGRATAGSMPEPTCSP